MPCHDVSIYVIAATRMPLVLLEFHKKPEDHQCIQLFVIRNICILVTYYGIKVPFKSIEDACIQACIGTTSRLKNF